ncbi:CitMHS family transporter [Saccharopolyspora sp. 7B]|uniref:CitMHS family transporter n=1 Tax=Saccharopolyspora sp. 7B TaxID=2877240 RepID=UPI001CD44032|nr:citrate:proton symporter [Saccharopolyspora sp. 7B]MCA1280849.1 citrate:proton symporter [Saccharopolyspora sp. 7B]
MLAVLGFATLGVFMALVMRRYLTAFVAIMATPVVFAVAAGCGGRLDEMMLNGLEIVAPTAILLLFAVLYFGVMMDAKLFDPISRGIIRLSQGDPARICVGTAVLALLVALDGDGTTSYMILCSAFLPIYLRLGINPLVLAAIATMALGTISGTTPWGGAATRGISVLHLDSTDYFVHMIAPMALTSLAIITISWLLGRAQRKRIDRAVIEEFAAEIAEQRVDRDGRTWRTWFNAGLTVLLLVLLVFGVAELVNLFMLAFVVALVVNHPRLADQAEVVKKHASSAVPVVMLVLGAGIFTGIMTDTGMTKAMADALLSVVPESMGNLLPLFTAVISLPLSFFMSNDAYFFGVLPVLAESAGHYGIPAVEIARAGAIGQMMHSIGPTSAPLWVLLGLVKRDLGEFQRFALPWVLLASVAYIAFAVLTGAISVV